jgi:membrane protein YqaA with SNARE-associated domain
LLRGRTALPALYFGSILESSFLPWPIEFPMLAYMLRGRMQTVVVTLVVTLGSVVGCLICYAIGRAAFGLLEGFIAARPALDSAINSSQARIDEVGGWAVALAMLAPTPVQLASFAAGVVQMNPVIFLVAALGGRAVRYAAMGVLVFFFGPSIIEAWRRLPRRVRTYGLLGLVIGFTALFAWTLARILSVGAAA